MIATMEWTLALLLGLALGAGGVAAGWLWQRGRWLAETAALQAQNTGLQLQLQAQIQAEQTARQQSTAELPNAIKALAADALAANTQSFLALAEQKLTLKEQAVAALVKPLADSLEKLSTHAQGLEKDRTAAYAGLTEQVKGLLEAHTALRSETGRLVTALRRPEGRGRWGEVQLRRVAELAGMLAHCDFYEQASTDTNDGRKQRPDMVVRLPGGKQVVVDSKAPLAALLDSAETADAAVLDERRQRFAQHVKEHIKGLSDKAYWAQFDCAPEFVVLFLPGESFFSTALQQDPELIEFAAERQVILATPTTLLALLKAVYYGWRQEALAENAQHISQLGSELYQRLVTLGGHWASVGKNLNQAVKSFNDATASLESRVLVSARRFNELQVAAADKSLPAATPIDLVSRQLQAPELQAKELPTSAAPASLAADPKSAA